MSVKAGAGRGRKPADTPNYQHIGYEAAWAAIRELRTFTLGTLITHIAKNKSWSVNDSTVKDYVYRLKKSAHIAIASEVQTKNSLSTYTYELVNDIGIHAPRITREGKESTQGLGREQLWRSMKMLSDFDARELALASSNDKQTVSESDAKSYIGHLAKAGYLNQTKPANPQGGLARYRLIPSKFTGPKAPQIQRVKRVYDPNINEVIWTAGDSHADQ